MSKLGQFMVLQKRQDWEQACQLAAKEAAKERGTSKLLIHFSKHPKAYPCLLAMMVLPVDETQPEAISQVRIACCFVYPEDASRLLEVQQDGQPELLEEAIADEAEKQAEYTPNPTAALLLGLTAELKAIGALRKGKLMMAVKRAHAWLMDTVEGNELSSVEEIVERFWEECDAR